MTSVWYIGLANVRAIYANQWTAAGHSGRPDSVWDATNGWSIPTSAFTAGQLTLLDADDEFNVAGTDGPRPGSAVIQGPAEISTRSWVQEQITGLEGEVSATYAGKANVVPKWAATTAYLAGDKVISPAGDTVTALTSFTSGATFNPANWSYSPTFVRGNIAKGIYIPYGWGSFWRPKLAAAKAGTGKAVLAITGDSISEGYSASNLDTKSWAGLLRIALQTGTGADGGSGFKSMSRSTVFAAPGARGSSISSQQITAYTANGNYWTMTGTWVEYTGSGVGPGSYAAKTITAGSKASTTVRGTSFTVYTTSNAGGNAAWTYSIDGATPVAVADGAGFAVQKTTVTGLSTGNHTIEIAYNGDGVKQLLVLGISAENATGVVVNNFSQYGQYSNTYLNDSGLKPGSWSGGSNYPADLVIYSLGLNDAVANITADTYSKNLRKYLDGVRDGITGKIATGDTDVLLLVQHNGTYDPTNLIYQDYAVRRRGIAETYGCAIVDMWADGRNSWNYWNGLGYWANGSNPGAAGTDSVHLSDAGMQHVADILTPYVAATS